eukprot:5205072-Prorocentrum_lima.AAC.1
MALWSLRKVNKGKVLSRCIKYGLMGHLVGLLRAQLSVPHLDVEGETAGEGRRAMGWTITSIWGKSAPEALSLP